MNVLQRMLLRRLVRFVRSPQGQRLAARARARLDTPANRAWLLDAAARVRDLAAARPGVWNPPAEPHRRPGTPGHGR